MMLRGFFLVGTLVLMSACQEGGGLASGSDGRVTEIQSGVFYMELPGRGDTAGQSFALPNAVATVQGSRGVYTVRALAKDLQPG
ncbi:MAG: hypothetical protein AAFQ50_13155, partial [Pseudomonadota bacterium]